MPLPSSGFLSPEVVTLLAAAGAAGGAAPEGETTSDSKEKDKDKEKQKSSDEKVTDDSSASAVPNEEKEEKEEKVEKVDTLPACYLLESQSNYIKLMAGGRIFCLTDEEDSDQDAGKSKFKI